MSAMSSYPSGDFYHLGHDQMAAKIAAVEAKQEPEDNDRLKKRFHVVGIEFA